VSAPARKRKKINILHASALGQFPWLIHGFSTRIGGFSTTYGQGELNLGFTKDDPRKTVERNRGAFAKKVLAGNKAKSPSKSMPLITLRQIHSDIIHCVDSPSEAQLFGDGLITNTPGLLLAIQTADCLPIILVDVRQRAVGVLHAGWRGTVKRVVEKGIGEMRRCFGTRPSDLKAAIGPGICGCCYEVGPEVRDQFDSQFAYAEKLFRVVEESDPVREKYPMLFLTARAPGHSELPKKIYLDLVEANRQQLLAAGVPAKNIEASALCTNCRPDLLFSYRREKGNTGRMMAVVGIKL
jgi:purine-nucleoside/S-methyl-5'-thioadenosine phosphorylase / adenosine deaminase